MDSDFIRKRITDLRIKKNVSEYKMSLDLGHSKSYIQNISSGRSMPSVDELLYICEYFGITPKAFFDDGESEPILIQEAVNNIRELTHEDLLLLIEIVQRLKK